MTADRPDAHAVDPHRDPEISAGLAAARLRSADLCVCGHVRDEHDAGMASCGMCLCEEYADESAV